MTRKELYKQFAAAYEQCRNDTPSPDSPENPRRVFRMAESVFKKYEDTLGPEDFLSVAFKVLGVPGETIHKGNAERFVGLFQEFALPQDRTPGHTPADRFVHLFASRFREALARAAKPRTDQHKRHPAFQKPKKTAKEPLRDGLSCERTINPRTGLRNSTPTQTKKWTAALQGAVEELPKVEQDIIRGRYWDDKSLRELEVTLGLGHGTAKARHDHAIDRLRRVVA